ncbi:hypothetical protein IM40_01685 [Candidatus Paracaedimonas acanthamoebae]|nr:hypothetical protein IM40_01685 [Candidatus Paracaedimonas acanthamoebae]
MKHYQNQVLPQIKNFGTNYQQFYQNQENLQNYRYYAGLWQQFAAVGYNILEDARLHLTDKKDHNLQTIQFIEFLVKSF